MSLNDIINDIAAETLRVAGERIDTLTAERDSLRAELSALRAAQPLTREKLDEMIDTTLNDLGAKYGYHMEQRVIRNVALREFRDALLDSLSLPVSEQ